jgi:hypothetical protein
MTILGVFNHHGKTLEIAEIPEGFAPGVDQRLSDDVRAPGAGQIAVHSMQAEAARRASGVRVALSGVVEGGPIASVAAELFLWDPEQGRAFGPVHTQYLAASKYRQAASKLIPVWSTPLAVQVSLPVGLRLITDGKSASLARLAPVQAGMVGPRLALQAGGEYTPAGGGTARRARAVFDPGRRLQELLVFVSQGLAQMPRAIQPAPGDRFRPWVGVFQVGEDTRRAPLENQPAGECEAMGNELTFGPAALRWYAAPMLPGKYLAGLAVTDLDGGVQRAFAPVSLG